MILRFYPTKDASIYELYPNKNTGLDSVLELSKTVIGTGSYNSRILLNFDYADISASIVGLGYDPNKFDYSLKLYATEVSEIPTDYTLYCYPVSGSWSMGIGRYYNTPETTEGVSWYYKQGLLTSASSAWPLSGFGATSTASWSSVPGGGTWYTSSFGSQSFSYNVADIDMDITSIIRKVQSGSLTFDGLMLKKSSADENSLSTFNSIKFFSKDTNTVYLPTIEAKFDDSVYNSGSLSLLDTTQEISLVASNLKPAYNELTTAKLRFAARYKYPPLTFATSSEYLISYRLPVGSQYALYYAESHDPVMDFSVYNKVSVDTISNYIKLHIDSLMPERYYKILIKVPNSENESDYEIIDQDWIFKVKRS